MSKKRKNQQGFTLMELLVVVVILGFLIGMVAPRLAGIIDDTVIDNVCDTNNKGARYFTKIFNDKTGRLPNDMTNLVIRTGASAYVIPAVEDGDPVAPETLAAEFVERNYPVLHVLNAAEAAEIKAMGLSHVRNLNDFEGSDSITPASDARPLERTPVAEDLGVAMIGMGAADSTSEINADLATWGSGTSDYPVGNPFWAGRIVLGLGKHNSLVTEGYVQAAALCPGGIQNAENVVFNSYCIILPRLAATVARFQAGMDTEHVFVDANDTTNGELHDVNLVPQEEWEFDSTCPEGHKWPDNDNDEWVWLS